MTKRTLALTVQFNDGPAPVNLKSLEGIQLDVFLEYAKQQLTTVPINKDITIGSLTDLQKISAIAAKIAPVTVRSVDLSPTHNGRHIGYYIDTIKGVTNYTAMIYATERRQLFHQTRNQQLTKNAYDHYAKLYNDGQALFGAPLENIKAINFQINE